MRRIWVALSLVAVIGAVALLAGCGGSDSADTTTEKATTAATTATQATSEATTAAAPTTTAPATTAPATTTAGGDAAAVAAGLVFFQKTCSGCHMADGTKAGGVGPKLAGMGLSADTIRNQVINGGGPMPAGLATGKDLDNVTAYVVSIQ